MARIFITGTAGFIGFHLARSLLGHGHVVAGFDGLTDYYDVSLKRRRHALLRDHAGFTATEAMLEDREALDRAVDSARPEVLIHLAAQAGVRFSLENPRAYVDSNIMGTFNVMEAARRHAVRHLMMASTSSVYGANTEMPFRETDKCDTPMTIYGATKKATEAMGHSYAHLYDLPTTMFRFFTVYGPWGRPDMALFKFVKATLAGEPIAIYNHGEMYRDFTYVDDLVHGIRLLMDAVPPRVAGSDEIEDGDSLSPVAPFRTVNIGNSTSIRLLDFVDAVEEALGQPVTRTFMDIQPGDVPRTWADASLLERLTGYRPRTDIRDGVKQFVDWYRAYYAIPPAVARQG